MLALRRGKTQLACTNCKQTKSVHMAYYNPWIGIYCEPMKYYYVIVLQVKVQRLIIFQPTYTLFNLWYSGKWENSLLLDEVLCFIPIRNTEEKVNNISKNTFNENSFVLITFNNEKTVRFLQHFCHFLCRPLFTGLCISLSVFFIPFTMESPSQTP